MVSADLVYVPLSLSEEGGSVSQQVPTLCVVTKELSSALNVLLSTEAYEKLKRVKLVVEDEAREIDTMEKQTRKGNRIRQCAPSAAGTGKSNESSIP